MSGPTCDPTSSRSNAHASTGARLAAEIASFGRAAQVALADSIVPFWWRAIDERNGGVFNCWDNTGSRLVSRDKFTWSQGRFAWLWSRLATLAARGTIPGGSDAFLAQAEKTAAFLQRHAILPDGRCAFLLSEEGAIKEAVPGAGPAPSIYADCFFVMGLAEFARVSGDRVSLDAAWQVCESIERRIAAGGFPTHPDPIPAGFDSYAITMIRLNVALVLREACATLHHAGLSVVRERTLSLATRIFDQFLLADGRIAELRPHDSAAEDSLLARHMNPGHALEGLWMLLTVARDVGRADWLARAQRAVHVAFERGWDASHGGLLHYVDRDGGAPKGIAGDSIYEAGVRGSWDTKLWWVHSEAVYAALLSYRLSGDRAMRGWLERVWEYAFNTFPHPDPAVGEWIQIRDRTGRPLDRVVALPVKDPYHIARNLIQVVELVAESSSS